MAISPITSINAALVSTLVAVACLLIFVFMLGGASYFQDIILGSWWLIAGISILAGVIRCLFKRESKILSAVCGVSVAVAGFSIVMLFIISRLI